MTGPEHYAAAEGLLEVCSHVERDTPGERSMFAEAQVHATLALAAATAMSHWNGPELPMPQPDRLAWERAASERPAAQARQRQAEREEAEEAAADMETLAREMYPAEYAAITDDNPMDPGKVAAVKAELARRMSGDT